MPSVASALIEPSVDMDRLSYEIFSILEAKFLFNCADPNLLLAADSSPPTDTRAAAGVSCKIRILSIDGGGDGLLAAAALARLESSLRHLSGDPSARIVDFFDLAAGSGAGGFLAALLFSGHPFSAVDALRLLVDHRRDIARRGVLRRVFRRSSGIFRKIFGDSSLKDMAKPVLIPCYDRETRTPFVFSRADAVETAGYDFAMREVCAATCGAGRGSAVEMRSVDGRTTIRALGGCLGMMNPAATAITHVLHNKREFPLVSGVKDLLVVSIGGGGGVAAPPSSSGELARIAGEGAADVVDQAVAVAFGHHRTTSYLRIQSDGLGPKSRTPVAAAGAALEERVVDSVMFRGRKVLEQSNAERLEQFAEELVKENERRLRSLVSVVFIK